MNRNFDYPPHIYEEVNEKFEWANKFNKKITELELLIKTAPSHVFSEELEQEAVDMVSDTCSDIVSEAVGSLSLDDANAQVENNYDIEMGR